MTTKPLKEATLKLVDKLIFGGIPVLSSLDKLGSWLVTATDKDDAFRKALVASYDQLFWAGLHEYAGDDIKIKEEFTTKAYIKGFRESVVWVLENAGITADSLSGVESVAYHPVIDSIKAHYVDDLLQLKFGIKEANLAVNIENHIRKHQRRIFAQLIAHSKAKYGVLLDYLSSDTHSAAYQTIQQDLYASVLMAQYAEEPLMGNEALTLQNLYIEPYIQVHERHRVKEEIDDGGYSEADLIRKNPNSNGPLDQSGTYAGHTLFYSILRGDIPPGIAENNHRLLLLLGSPGQGKSSFCKRLLYDHFSGIEPFEQELFFIRLRDIGNTESLFNDPKEVLEEAIVVQAQMLGAGIDTEIELQVSPKQFSNSILILDGLDELYMSDQRSEKFALDLVKRLIDMLGKHPKMHLVITSRHGRITAEDLQNQESLLIGQLSPLTLAQQKQWLTQYQGTGLDTPLSHELLDAIHAESQYKHIEELIGQAILLYMVASLKDDLTTHTSRTDIYDRLFTQLVAREYDNSSNKALKPHVELCDKLSISLDELPTYLRGIIQELAFLIYQQPNEYIHKEDILEADSSHLQEFFELDDDIELKERLRLLMLSFYLKETPHQGKPGKKIRSDFALEFLHKSLQEFLTAEYMLQAIIDMCQDFEEAKHKKKRGHRKKDRENWEDFLELMQKLFGQQRITGEIAFYLTELISKRREHGKDSKAIDLVATWMQELLNDCIRVDMLYYFDPTISEAPITTAHNTFFGYYLVFSHALGKEAFGTFQKNVAPDRWKYLMGTVGLGLKGNLFPQYFLQYSNLYLADLSNADLSNADLREAVLRKADLRKADLRKADLSNADLRKADLSNADLREAVLREADLSNAVLREAVLRKAVLREADLSNAVLREAVLREADLSNAVLSNAVLSNADLRKADLREADLREADLREADLREADLREAVLSNADLKEAVLRKAVLRKADLSYADLRKADLREADLRKTDLSNADLSNADLSNAVLSNSDLSNADLSNADLSNADLSNADLREADLSDADLREAVLSNADLSYAVLSYAVLSYAVLSYAVLSYADLREADLSYADLSYADLREADLSNADLREADLSNADLRGAVLFNTRLTKSQASYVERTGVDVSKAIIVKEY